MTVQDYVFECMDENQVKLGISYQNNDVPEGISYWNFYQYQIVNKFTASNNNANNRALVPATEEKVVDDGRPLQKRIVRVSYGLDNDYIPRLQAELI